MRLVQKLDRSKVTPTRPTRPQGQTSNTSARINQATTTPSPRHQRHQPGDSMSNFEIHKKNTHGRRSPKRMVSIMKSGVLGISADVHEWLGRPEEVEYLYDRTRKVLALRAAPGSQNAYRVSRAAKTGYAQVSAVTVCREYSID